MSRADRTRQQLEGDLAAMSRRVAELEKALGELKPGRSPVEHFRQQLEVLFEYASDGYLLVDSGGNIIDGNKALEELAGYSRRELLGKNLLQSQLVHPDDLPKIMPNLAKAAAGQPTGPTEYTLTRKDGTRRTVETKAFAVRAGEQTLILSNARDITERKRIEEALRRAHDEMEVQVRARTADLAKANEELRVEVEQHRKTEAALRASEETYRLVAENQTDVVWAMDMNLRHTYCSPSITRLRGVGLEEAMAEAVEDFLTPSSLKVAMEALAEELAVENMGQKDLSRTRNLVLEMTCKDGSTVWTDNTISPLRDAEGRLVGIVGVSRDISARRKAEEELRASEERYRVLAENANEMVAVAQDDVLKYSNPKAVQTTGYSREEMSRMSFTELIHPDDRRMVTERYLRRLSGEEFTHIYPFRVVDKTGRIRWVEINAIKIAWEGRPATLNFLNDITERQTAEEALRKSEARFRALIENASDVIIIIGEDGVIRYESPAVERMLGYKPADLVGLDSLSFIHPDNIPRVTEQFGQILRRPDTIIHAEVNVRHKDGSWRVAEATGQNLLNDPAVGGIVVNFRDITERKSAEAELRQAKQDWENTFQAIGHPSLVLDPQHGIIAANRALLLATGRALEDVVGKKCYEVLHGPESDGPPEGCPVETMIASGKVETFEAEVQALHGVFLVSCTPVLGEEGRVDRIIHIATDITDRRKAEDALKASEERYRLVVENANEAIVVAQDGFLKFSNPKAWELLGRSREELTTTPWLALVHPEDHEMMLERYEKRVRGDELPLTYQFRVVDSSGNLKWVETNAVFITWEGKPATLNFMSDITSRKKAEADVARHVKRVEALHAVARTVSETLDMGDLLNSTLEKVVEVMGADIGSIYILDEPERVLSLKAQRGMTEEFVRNVAVVTLDDKELETLKQWKQPQAPLSQVRSRKTLRSVSEALEKEQIRSFAAVPLSVKGNLQGVVSVGSRTGREFTADDLDLLVALGSEIGVGIENSRLLERTRELSITDALTGLYNRRHFYETLEVEISRTQRYGRPFSVVMIDLDGFKEYNDKFGHTTGDAALKAFATTLRSALRKTDIAFRYGGDEFTIIQPGIDADRAGRIVERIRSRWLQSLRAEKLDLETPLGFSAGISQFPEDAGTTDALVSLADAALYGSKRAGGYRTTLSSDLATAEANARPETPPKY